MKNVIDFILGFIIWMFVSAIIDMVVSGVFFLFYFVICSLLNIEINLVVGVWMIGIFGVASLIVAYKSLVRTCSD